MSQSEHVSRTAATTINGGLLHVFLHWYFTEHPHEAAAAYFRYARAFGESFSLMFMFRTLFAPWKSIADDYPDGGFNLTAVAETFFLNLTSRLIGFVVRLCAIIVGIAFQALLLCGFLAYVLIWVFFPLLVVTVLPALLVLGF